MTDDAALFRALFPPLLVALLFSGVAVLLTLLTARIVLPMVARTRRRYPASSAMQLWPAMREMETTAIARILSWAGVTSRRAVTAIGTELVFAVVLSVLFRSSLPFVVAVLVLLVEGIVVFWRSRRQRRRFILQLPDALDALTQALRAGYAFSSALALVRNDSPEPVRHIIAALTRADEYQMSVRTAARIIDRQLHSPEWMLVTETLEVQDRIGGNVIPLLSQTAQTIREKVRVDNEVGALTASGRFSGIVIGLLAPFSFAAFYLFAPSYVSILLTTTLGNLFLVTAAVLEIAGFALILRIVRVDY